MRPRRFRVAPGVELAVREWPGDPAKGVPFLLVHGLASNARLWDGVAERLAERGHAVAAVDLRGHGRSSKPDGGYDFATVADDLVAVVEGLRFERPVAAGQSWGADVVLELAQRRPAVLRGVACVDGGTTELAGRFPTWEECAAALAPPRTEGTPVADLEARFRAAHPDWPESGIQGALAGFQVRHDGTVAPWLTLDRHLAILRALWERRPSAHYADLEVPVLLVPADDPANPPWTAAKRDGVEAALAAIPRVRARWFSPADHDVHAQHPHEVADLLHACAEEGFFA